LAFPPTDTIDHALTVAPVVAVRSAMRRFPVQCPVGSSTFRFGYQGGNPWYRKLMVANARVPVRSVQIWRDGAWNMLTKTIDNYVSV
jgi:expansin (peptidoglycan-binding protein)